MKAQPQGQPADPCTVVIFGASGDLTKRKLIPAVANLRAEQLLAPAFAVVGVATRPWSVEDFRLQVREDLEQHATGELSGELKAWLEDRLFYLSGNFQNDGTYAELKKLLAQIDEREGTKGN